jgi:hypothetical protein
MTYPDGSRRGVGCSKERSSKQIGGADRPELITQYAL